MYAQGRIAGRQKTHEDSRVACLWTFVLNIVGERLTGRHWKRQDIDSQ